jgi:hypothetical protein
LAPRELFSTLFYVSVILYSLGSFDHHCNYTTLIVVGMAPAVVVIATALELAPYGSLGRLPVGNLNVEPTRVFKELQT